MLELQHYRQIDIIRRAEEMVSIKSKIKPFDISHWNSGEQYKKILMQELELPPLEEYINYTYSYSLSPKLKNDILVKHQTVNATCVLFNSATSAIATVCSVLKSMKLKKVCLINPSYFSVFEYLTMLNFDVQCINYDYDGQYHIPFDLIEKDTELVWITQPVFSTGTYLEDEELIKLLRMPYFFVCDGSMCDTINHLPNFTIDCSKAIFLFSPQKVISLNGIKFCYVLCSQPLRQAIEDWGDVISGGILASSMLAINHYLSENYARCVKIHSDYVKASHTAIDRIISDSNNQIIKCGKSLDSTYETLTINHFPYIEKLTLDIMYDLINKTYVSITPGCANGFDQQNGFCFRINHTLDISLNCMALNRIITYFVDLKPQLP